MQKSANNLQQAVRDLSKELRTVDIHPNESMARHTTLKVGGPAELLLHPRNLKQLKHVMCVVEEQGMPWRVIGRGSNLLVRDGGIRGAVIKLDDGFSDVIVNGTHVEVGGGCSTIRLAAMMTKHGLTGFEFAGGIPGNIGGAVYMNAGAHGSDIAAVLVEADVLLNTGKLVTLSNRELQFRYRTSVLQQAIQGIVITARFQLERGSKQDISEMLSRFKNYRKETQPLQFPCAGSVFRNPPGAYAGNLIEQAGLKGYSIGGAQVSVLHSNFIVNMGEATAKDVLSLIDHIIETVDKRFNVRLIPEVLVIGQE